MHLCIFLVNDLCISFASSILGKIRNPYFINKRKQSKSLLEKSKIIPQENIQHVTDLFYFVLSCSGSSYFVDLADGRCTCLEGKNGALCKHQLAASQKFNVFHEPNLFSLLPEMKYFYFEIVTGERASQGFFDLPLTHKHALTQSAQTESKVSIIQKAESLTNSEIRVENDINITIMSNSERIKRREKMINIVDKLDRLASDDPHTLDNPLDTFVKRMENLISTSSTVGIASGLASAFSQYEKKNLKIPKIHFGSSKNKTNKITSKRVFIKKNTSRNLPSDFAVTLNKKRKVPHSFKEKIKRQMPKKRS